jgi:23S rRNA pseudouridine2605 synthase
LETEEIEQLETGVRLDDEMTAPARLKKIRKVEENSWIELTIYEGRTHQVKRMLEAVGHPVLKLKRIRFGPLMLGPLPLGEYRFLTDPEIHRLKAAAANRHTHPRPSPVLAVASRVRKGAPRSRARRKLTS